MLNHIIWLPLIAGLGAVFFGSIAFFNGDTFADDMTRELQWWPPSSSTLGVGNPLSWKRMRDGTLSDEEQQMQVRSARAQMKFGGVVAIAFGLIFIFLGLVGQR